MTGRGQGKETPYSQKVGHQGSDCGGNPYGGRI